METNLLKMDLKDLKAIAFDIMAQQEKLNSDLQKVVKAIQTKSQQEQEDNTKTKETVKEAEKQTKETK